MTEDMSYYWEVMDEELHDELAKRSAVMPVGRQASRKSAARKTARGKQVSKEIGKTRNGIRHRRLKRVV